MHVQTIRFANNCPGIINIRRVDLIVHIPRLRSSRLDRLVQRETLPRYAIYILRIDAPVFFLFPFPSSDMYSTRIRTSFAFLLEPTRGLLRARALGAARRHGTRKRNVGNVGQFCPRAKSGEDRDIPFPENPRIINASFFFADDAKRRDSRPIQDLWDLWETLVKY